MSESSMSRMGVVVMVLAAVGGVARGGITVKQVYCEYTVDPLGVDTSRPRFSWVLESDRRGEAQSAYQILVAGSEQKLAANVGDMWDSGKVISDRSVNVPYEGAPLASSEKCWWKLRCWNRDGARGDDSRPATFEMGLLTESDWQGDWIGLDSGAWLDYVAGRFGQSVRFDGASQTVRIPHYDGLKPPSQITLSAWIKPSDELGAAWREIYRKEDGDARHLLALGKTGEITGVWLGLGIGGKYVEFGANASLEQLADGQWHLITGSYDGSFMRLYVDGREIGRQAANGSLSPGGKADAHIGSYGGRTEFFPGGIDDVRIYDRSLSAAEVRAMAAGESPPAPQHLVAWWPMDGDLKNRVAGSDGKSWGGSAPAPLLRTQFNIDRKVKRARVYIAGLGWSELYINGRKVGDHVLDPATTDYAKRVLYVTHDVTRMLAEGPNVFGVMLGNGWYSEPGRLRYGDAPRLRLHANIELADGTRQHITTGPEWKASEGPITRNDLWGGEAYDARLDKEGWTKAGYDDAKWPGAAVTPSPGGPMVSQLMPAIKVNRTIKPVTLTQPRPGVYVYDMGRLFGGWARLRVKGPRGTKVTIKYSARIFADSGLLDKSRHRGGGETDYYVLKGDPEGEAYEPRFTYHPVRYVQIEGYPGRPTIDDLAGRVVYSAVDPSGDFGCSNRVLERIHENVLWTLTNELFGIPLDCLHREHWAWTDPATVTGTLYPRKFMPLFWTKWLRDIADAQREDGAVPDICPTYPGDRSDPAWGGNYPILVWYLYQYYDDRRLLEEHYDGMKRCVAYLTSIAENHIVVQGHYGDHMLPGPAPGQEQFISKETPPPLIWTGYYYRAASVIGQAAKALGKTDEAEQYARLADRIKDAFNRKWLNRNDDRYATGSPTAHFLPLALGIVPEEDEAGVLANVVADTTDKYQGHLHTGNTGTTCMIDTLTERGHGDLMYRIATQTTYPGWGYMVAQGATTIWEVWGLGRGAESMAMWNTIDEFFYGDLAGIEGPDYYGPGFMEPGFRRIRIAPRVLGDLTRAEASIRTVRGIVSARWNRSERSLALEVSLPVNSRARVSVPKAGFNNVTVSEGGDALWQRGAFVEGVSGISSGRETPGDVTFDVGSGTYRFLLTGE